MSILGHMKTYTVVHRHNGYLQHSYVVASSELAALAVASEKYDHITNVLPLNKEA